jgi:hypothetical protein
VALYHIIEKKEKKEEKKEKEEEEKEKEEEEEELEEEEEKEEEEEVEEKEKKKEKKEKKEKEEEEKEEEEEGEQEEEKKHEKKKEKQWRGIKEQEFNLLSRCYCQDQSWKKILDNFSDHNQRIPEGENVRWNAILLGATSTTKLPISLSNEFNNWIKQNEQPLKKLRFSL